MANPGATATISVAMCTYNGERYLREQLETIAAQTRPPLELVACDDGSHDGTLWILEAFASKAPFPVRIVRNPQRLGSTANFDQAIRLCRGDYISLSDQDDRWLPEKFVCLAGLLDEQPEVGMVFSDGSLLEADGRRVQGSLWQRLRFTPAVRARFAIDPGRVLLQRDVVSGHTMLFRRALLPYFGSIPLSWPHDGWLTWMCVFRSHVRFVPEQLSCYRLHSAQAIGIRPGAQANGRERARYARVARQFADLLAYVEQGSPALAQRWRVPLERKIAFLEARANAPQSALERALFILQHARAYFQLARGWRSMSKDCLLGPPGTG